jgi:hypothetical protein
MRKLMRKRVLVPVAAIAALALAGIAIAYFTASGTGSGTATVGADAGVTITDVRFDRTLYPGGSTDVSFTVTNLSADTDVNVGEVVTDSIRTSDAGCLPADFSFGDVAIGSIPAGDSVNASGTLSMQNTAANQDDCQNATVDLNLRVDNSGI